MTRQPNLRPKAQADNRQEPLGKEAQMIEATNLTKRYGKTVAVNEVSFTASPGK